MTRSSPVTPARVSPTARSRPAFPWTADLACDPSAIEIARLWPHALAVNEAFRARWIHREVVRQGLVRRARMRVPPCNAAEPGTGRALPFAVRAGQRRRRSTDGNHGVRERKIERRRTRRFQQTQCTSGSNELSVADAHDDFPRVSDQCRWPRVIPDGLLSRSRMFGEWGASLPGVLPHPITTATGRRLFHSPHHLRDAPRRHGRRIVMMGRRQMGQGPMRGWSPNFTVTGPLITVTCCTVSLTVTVTVATAPSTRP